MLFEFITAHRGDLIARTRAKVAKRVAPRPTEHELEGVPLFMEQLVETLRLAPPAMPATMNRTAALHGAALLERGYTVGQVVHDYGDVCQAITELAGETDAPISTEEFHILNLCLDNAIAEAITEYMRLRDHSTAEAELERSGVFAHELRNKISAARLGFDVIQSGVAPTSGSVAAIVTRNLKGMASLINRALLEVRVDSGSTRRERIHLHQLLEEAEVDGMLEASVYGVSLTVTPTDRGVDVEADPQVLVGAIANLLQNAFKFTRKGGHVALRTSVIDGRVRIEIEDECGGLPGGLPKGNAAELFEAFRQRGTNRRGLGLGLFISHKGVVASGGTLSVRDIPGIGCIFTIALPVARPV
jgi:signal transduction histidine kinase